MQKKYIFVGNRRFVLEEMLRLSLDIKKIYVIEGSHLHKDINSGALKIDVSYEVVRSGLDLFESINQQEFDILISNGCPFIFPLNLLNKGLFVNIHPSYLPDLKGVDPVVGAIYNKRDSGATCHLIDKGIDTGPIISQVLIPYSNDLDVVTLYQLSFMAEKEVFMVAYTKNFENFYAQKPAQSDIYFKRSDRDRIIFFDESNEKIIQKIRSFNNYSAGARFFCEGNWFKVFDGEIMQNEYLLKIAFKKPSGYVIFSYEDCIIFHKDGQVLRFKNIISENNHQIHVGDNLFDSL